MILTSTTNRTSTTQFCTAVTKGLADDGGLYVPVRLPRFEASFIGSLRGKSLPEIALEVLRPLLRDEIPDEALEQIVRDSFTFPAPLRQLGRTVDVLELFHGPTLAFKDFGARFMAQTLRYLDRHDSRERTVLVATSGDTGSAVAHGFAGVASVHVVLLYPSGKVSRIQELQLTTVGGNVTALEIDGTFDDCQHLVKQAFADGMLKEKRRLTSANSINIARLLPQMVYYFGAVSQLPDIKLPVVFSVPSGNLGNLTAGLLAWILGLPVASFVSATNANDVFVRYVSTGTFTPRTAIPTLSNAMDVGNPGNLKRIRAMFGDDLDELRRILYARSFSDPVTQEAIRTVFRERGYILDPHGAVAYLALQEYRREHAFPFRGIVLETAHPAKFPEAYPADVLAALSTPDRLTRMLGGTKVTTRLSSRFTDFHDFLIDAHS